MPRKPEWPMNAPNHFRKHLRQLVFKPTRQTFAVYSCSTCVFCCWSKFVWFLRAVFSWVIPELMDIPVGLIRNDLNATISWNFCANFGHRRSFQQESILSTIFRHIFFYNFFRLFEFLSSNFGEFTWRSEEVSCLGNSKNRQRGYATIEFRWDKSRQFSKDLERFSS